MGFLWKDIFKKLFLGEFIFLILSYIFLSYYYWFEFLDFFTKQTQCNCILRGKAWLGEDTGWGFRNQVDDKLACGARWRVSKFSFKFCPQILLLSWRNLSLLFRIRRMISIILFYHEICIFKIFQPYIIISQKLNFK